MRPKQAVIAALMLLSPAPHAGELECLFRCDLSGVIVGVEWKPSSSRCYKPSAPFLFVSNARDYNNAVQSFNQWIEEMNTYLSCVQNEAADDLKKMPDIFVQGLKKVQRETSDEITRARTNLQLQRPIR